MILVVGVLARIACRFLQLGERFLVSLRLHRFLSGLERLGNRLADAGLRLGSGRRCPRRQPMN